MTNQIKITKENAIAQVQSSVSSIFSKDDVLLLLNAIEQQQSDCNISCFIMGYRSNPIENLWQPIDSSS